MANFKLSIQFWYRQNKRLLPWRETSDPYKIWLSEIILQQTRVEQGMNYYLKFVANYPTIADLANAAEDEVLNLWQGLGYYSRARNMHFSAKQIMTNFGGVFPSSYKDILSLKGVGSYTAAAISSIAYGLPYAVVDGNVYRVLSRYFAISTPIDTTKGKKEFAQIAQELLDKDHPGEHNQALMEIGALICAPKLPKCTCCPLENACISKSKNEQLNFPIKEKKIKVKNRFFNYLIVTNGNEIILKKRNKKDIWEGLYDFPLLEKEKNEPLDIEDLKRFNKITCQEDGFFKHILSHQIIHATFWIVKVEAIELYDGEISIPYESIKDYPMPQLLIRYINASEHFTTE